MMDLTGYLRSELFVLIPVLYLVGIMLKRSPLKDWLIPYVICGIGVLLSFAYLAGQGIEAGGGIWRLLFSAVTQGILCAACSVYAKNLIKQFTERKEEGKTEDETEEDAPDL